VLKENESVHPQIGAKFSAKYEGSLKIVRRAIYTFTAEGAKLSLDGRAVAGPVELDPGEHAIEIAYERKGGGPARLQVMWASDLFMSEPIPASVLSYKPSKEAERQALVERGRTLVEELNCAGCHRSAGLSSRVGPDLTNVGARVNAAWIAKWLENPQHFRAGAVMPVLLSKAEERRDVAAYLATLKDGRRKVNDYNPSKSKAAQGKQLFESIGCANCHQEQMGLDGLGSKWASIGQLAAYLRDPLAVDRSGRMPAMQLSDEEAVALANHLMGAKKAEFEAALPEGADVAHGEQLFRTVGCLNCHTAEGDAGKPLGDAAKAPALEKLDPARGCLSEKLGTGEVEQPAGGLKAGDRILPIDGQKQHDFTKITLNVALGTVPPRYSLSAEGRAAIAAFLDAVKTSPLVSAAPAHDFVRTLQKLNCGACHETDQSKPQSEDAEKLPPLTAVGAKLKKDWISQVLHDKRARVRFWLKTRMPEFGGAIDHVAEQAVAAAGVDEAAEPTSVTPTTAMTQEGQRLVGANDPKKNPSGMGCVTCHSLREFKPAVAADATRGPELTLMSTRLRSDFFRRWMHEPARIQAGTAMPNFFTDKPREEAARTIDTLWAYASLGQSMPAPVGVKEKRNYTLIVTDTPIVSRCQVPDPAGTIVYGISVGLPGMINYTFDAEHVMFRTAWRGGFLDMSGDWDGRGGNPVRVLGKRFYSQAVAPLRIGDAEVDAPRVFKGYELKERIPTFIYTVGGVEVRERITAVESGVGIIRTFELDPGNRTVYFQASDEANATLSIANGQFKATPVRKSIGSADKVAGQVIEFPPAGKLTFAVTIRAK
jgi:mono/diheme cytochrome c family protein